MGTGNPTSISQQNLCKRTYLFEMQDACCRYAHQLVYDETRGAHYMFGGNPGGRDGMDGKLRLGDFWRLVLVRPSVEDLGRRCSHMIRRTK